MSVLMNIAGVKLRDAQHEVAVEWTREPDIDAHMCVMLRIAKEYANGRQRTVDYNARCANEIVDYMAPLRHAHWQNIHRYLSQWIPRPQP